MCNQAIAFGCKQVDKNLGRGLELVGSFAGIDPDHFAASRSQRRGQDDRINHSQRISVRAESECLGCTRRRGVGKLRRRNAVCLGYLERAVQLFLQPLGNHGQAIEAVLVAFRWERVVLDVVSPLRQRQVTTQHHSLTRCRNVAAGKRDRATRVVAGTADVVVS